MSDGMSDMLWEVTQGREQTRRQEIMQDEEQETTAPEIDAHYSKLAIQPMQYSMDNKLDPLQHTIIKYVTRFRDKGGKRDLLAARKTIDMLIEYEYGDNK